MKASHEGSDFSLSDKAEKMLIILSFDEIIGRSKNNELFSIKAIYREQAVILKHDRKAVLLTHQS